jgi:endonuclease VIII-like 1
MPELAEVKLTADYINRASYKRIYESVKKNTNHKGELFNIPFKNFNIFAESRGKELVLYIIDLASDRIIPIRMSMGMSGHFRLSKTGNENKHAHLMFISNDNYTLSFVDVRRFGKWKFGYHWSSNRGPDPIRETDAFIANVMDNLDKKVFNKPIHEVLMNQQYFNGIGNYIRSEVLFRIPELNPFITARDAIKEKGDEIFMLCKTIPELAYVLGGGEIKDWVNPFKNETDYIKTKGSFFLCYGNKKMSQIVDKTGRRFWYDPKWDNLDMETEWDHYSGLPNLKLYENR